GRHFLQTRTVMVDSQGATRGVLVASLDVTEKHQAEQALAQEQERVRDQIVLTRQVIDESPSAMYLKDRQGRYVTVNDAWLKMVGVTRERAIGHSVLDLFREKESDGYQAEDMRLLAAGEGVSEVESLRTGPDGKPQWVIVRKAVMRNAEGEVVGLIGANTDITRLKQYEAELRENVRLREEVERMSRHDLQTPLTSVIAMARLLREGGRVAPEDAELLATIERAGYRILNMVNLSLDLFRMETGTYQFHPQAVDVAEVARRVAGDLEAQAASKNIDVRVRANGLS